MGKHEARGCLSIFFGPRLRGGSEDASAKAKEGRDEPLLFRLRDDFLSPAEFSFFKVLVGAIDGQAVVCCKVNLADLFFAIGENKVGTSNRINRKHVDFLVCDPVTMKPRCGIELDDASHQRKGRQERDELVEAVFAAAELPLVRVAVQTAYSAALLRQQIAPYLGVQAAAIATPPPRPAPPPPPQATAPPPLAAAAPSQPPLCPKCQVAMVVRVAKKGPRAGQKFFACPNYPNCREIVPV
ncbi:MAG: DUF2726 domain-containing protein [Planctomycetales bacterium]|nr:DUF2726 domain-containing protein [Planctomycetales bacterium]